jgi:hypothetical protein
MGCDNVGSQNAESTRNSWNHFPRHGPLPKNAEAVQKFSLKTCFKNHLVQGVHIYVIWLYTFVSKNAALWTTLFMEMYLLLPSSSSFTAIEFSFGDSSPYTSNK